MYKYKKICVKINNLQELDSFIDMLNKSKRPPMNALNGIYEYLPNYLFIYLNEKQTILSYLTSGNIYSDYSIDLLNTVLKDEGIDPIIYNINDINKIRHIINRHSHEPTYKPKKNLRLLESYKEQYFNVIKKEKTIYPYRFKTEQEFIDEFGYNWRNVAFPGLGWGDRMDTLIGQDFPYDKNSINLNTINNLYEDDRLPINSSYYYNNGHWTISWNMLTPNIKPNIKPNYKPKKNLRLLENNNNNLSPILTPEEQKNMFKIGEIVKIREDAFNYFLDTCENMRMYLGKKVKIINIQRVKDIYTFADDINIYFPSVNINDLMITVEKVDYINDHFTWYWYYRCFEKNIPTYKPKKIIREI